MEAASRRISVGGVLSEAFRIYGQHAAPLLGSAVIVFVVVGVISGLLQSGDSVVLAWLAGLVSFIGITFYTGVVVRLVEDVRDGRRDFGIGALFRSVQGVLGSLLVNSVLRSIAIAIGFVLLIIPGLILLTVWAVTAPAIVVERRGAVEAFGRSWELVRGQSWQVFGVLVVVFLLVIVVSATLAAIGAAIGTAGAVIAAVVANVLVAPAFALASAVMFFDLGGGSVAASEPAAGPAEPSPLT
ncbi:MAG TPA: YciC family protein [Solirubrobacterales bacterium]|nr:YciC family protein [Solirubrobacterales bacterium]